MFALLSRIFGSLIIGVCLSSFTILLLTLIMTARNLTQILSGLQKIIRSILRGSFRLYNAILRPVRVWAYQSFGLDILDPVIRTLITTGFSLVIGVGILLLLSWQIRVWEVIIFLLHGIFVGLAWESILYPNEFQLGVNLE